MQRSLFRGNGLLRRRQSENLFRPNKNLREFVAAIEILNEVLLTKGKWSQVEVQSYKKKERLQEWIHRYADLYE